MPIVRLLRRTLSAPRVLALALLALLSAIPSLAATAAPGGLVISQVFGGGGNSGAIYTNDFIEIFNGTSAPISLVGYSVQYASSTGSAWQVTALGTNGGIQTLPAGAYYLIQESLGTGGTTPLPTPDQSGTISISATAGKVALSSSTAALSGTCPSTNSSLVDIVSFGTASTSCFGTPTPTLSNTTSAIRKASCTNTQNNSADFTVVTSGPPPATPARNTATTPAPCPSSGGTSTIGISGLANPATINAGASTLLTATITPASSPASTGITVTANLFAIGGSTTQKLYDDGSNGDVTPNDNVFSFSTIVNTTGSFSLPITAGDSQLHSGNGTIALTVNTPPQTVSIRAIQSAKPSSYLAQKVTTSGIVVGVRSNGFYLEAKDADTNPTTPEGILVTSSTGNPASVTLGTEIQVSGTVGSYPALTTSPTPDTEIDGPTAYTVLSTNNPLPTPVRITTTQDSPSGGIYQFTKYEGMRVAIDSLTTTEGTDAVLTEATETNVSNGIFYGVVTGVPRPFREPGISLTDSAYTQPIPATVPRFDSNPELLEIDSLSFGAPAINLTANTVLSGVSGVMDFSTGVADIILDAANRPTITGGGLTIPTLPLQTAKEFTVASFNMERFYTSDPNAARNPGSSIVVVTPAAYQRRLQKASIAIRNVLNSPDIIGAQEIQDLQVLTDLSNQISTDAKVVGQTDPVYSPYLFLATDGTGINTGFLVKNTVTVQKVEQFGLTTTFTNANGAQATLNDRTPLVLHAGIKRAGGPDYPITVIDVHQRSLNGVDDPTSTGQTVRLKREAQAEYLANLIQSYQSAGEHVISVGDYNSFQFSDGFVDTIGVTKGNPVPANQVIIAPSANLVTPNLIDLITTLPATQQQTYTFSGSAQVLDHVLITQDLLPYFDSIAPAHFDADFPLINLNDATTPSRVSDHDPSVAYFAIPPIPVVQGTVQLTLASTIMRATGGGYQVAITLTNNGTGTAPAVQLNSATLGSATAASLPIAVGNIAPGSTLTFTVNYAATAGLSGTNTIQRYSFTYTGGTFAGGYRAALP